MNEEATTRNGGPELNGQAPAVANAELAATAETLKQLNPVIRQVVGNTLRGLLVSCPGVPPHVILHAVAWQTGNLLAGAFAADLQTSFAMRKAMKEAFGDGVQKAPLQQPPVPGGPFKG